MKTITLNGDKLIIKFDYDEDVVRKIKTLPGRIYNAPIRSWSVPKLFVGEVICALKPLQFELSPEVEELAKGDVRRSITSDLPLFSYQKEGAEFLMNNRFVLLGDQPGLGKTLQALVACEELGLEKILVITMASLKENFAEEAKKWYPKSKVLVIASGNGQAKRIEEYKTLAKYYVINYETMVRDVEILQTMKWDMIIADECTKIHNPQTKMAKSIKLLVADRKVAMTGTIISNTPANLWSPVTWLLPGLLGNWWQFRTAYCTTDYWGNITAYQNLEHLQKRIAPYILRREKKEVMKELPEKTYVDVSVELSAGERKIYNAVKSEILNYLEEQDLSKIDLGTINNILTKMIRLLQVADSCELVGDNIKSSKLEALKELLESLGGEKVVIFTRFAQMAEILKRELNELEPLIVTGDTPQNARMGIIKQFEAGTNKVLISTETLGYGVNLQFCRYVINYDLPWSLGKLEQREGRIDRIGQKNPMTFYSLIVKNSMDEFVRKTLYAKQKTSKDILEGIKNVLR